MVLIRQTHAKHRWDQVQQIRFPVRNSELAVNLATFWYVAVANNLAISNKVFNCPLGEERSAPCGLDEVYFLLI